MRPILPVLLFSALAFPARAQQITNVTWNPSPLHACQSFTLNVIGTAAPGMNFTFVNNNSTANSLTLVIDVNTGSPGSASFNKPIGPMAALGEGVYALSISLRYNNTILTTWTGNMTVLPPDLPDVGEPASVSICPNAAPFTLLSQLGGTPSPGGEWIDPMLNVVANGMFVPGVSLPGDYLYIFNLEQPCEPVGQVLTIAYLPNNSAGTSATVTLCTLAGLPPVDLFTKLGGTPMPGGTWAGPSGASGIFTPGVSAPGQYVYQVAPIAPCPAPTATVTVIGGAPSNAGIGDSALYCWNETSAHLADHLTGSANSGIWYSPAGLGMGYYNESFNVSAYGAGEYLYVVTSAPCPSDTAFVHVTLDGPPCTVGVGTPQHDGALALHPNPARGSLTVEVPAALLAPGNELLVTDVHGRTVLRAPASARQQLDLSGLKPGVYAVTLHGRKQTAPQRLVVQ